MTRGKRASLHGARRWANCAFLLAGLFAWGQDETPDLFGWEDPAKIKTEEACRECHASAYDVWQETPHAKGFKTLHRKEAAMDIAERMGFRLIKRESLCLNCHYTPIEKDGQIRAESGVSCESCHGAGADWIDLHNDYGGKGFTFQNETPEHKAQRIARSRELGMRRPSDMYALAARCFQCHIVPNEKLVNVGGHGTGSADFELAAWSQGEIRHNFLQSFLTGDGLVNAERPQAYKRVLYVLGRALDVEHSLRGVAVAKDRARYFQAMSRRLRKGLSELRAIQSVASMPELAEILTTARGVKALPNNGENITRAADEIRASIQRFLARREALDLAALDPLLAGEALPEPEPEETVAATPDQPAPAPDATTAAAATPTEATSPAPAAAAGGDRPAAPTQAVGEFKRFARPRSTFQTIGPGKCSSCHRHEKQSAWWFNDPHSLAINPFFEQNPKNVKIARLYGISPAKMTRGDQICMDCHGTVVSGKERREVSDGASCESCHGPAAAYVEIHQEGDPAEGLQRSGYVAALKQGMQKLREASVAAARCAECHYITEARLISAGHPSGANFDIAAAMGKIDHWDHPAVQSADLKGAYAAVVSKRGPVPQPALAALPETRVAADSNAPATDEPAAAGGGGSASVAKAPPRPSPPKPRPVDPISVPDSGDLADVDVAPFPEINDDAPLGDVLLLLKQRLEKLHREVRQNTSGRNR